MDDDYNYNSPRSYSKGKKKSGLAKYAASRSHRKVASSEESDEVDSSKMSYPYSSRSRNRHDDEEDPYALRSRNKHDDEEDSYYRQSSSRSPRYPIEAKVEVRDRDRSSRYGRSALDEDSDEGIELNNSNRYGASRSSNDGTLNRLKSLNVDTLDSQESEEERTSYSRGGSYRSSYKGEKRYRDQNSDGDDFGRSRNRKQLLAMDSDDQDIIDSMPTHPRYSRASKTSPTRSHSPDRSPSRLGRYSNMDVDKSDDSPGDTYSRAKSDDESDLYDRYRQLLSKDSKKSSASNKGYSSSNYRTSLDEVDRELEDNVPDLRRKVLTHNTRSSLYPARTGSPVPPLQKKDTANSMHSSNSVSSSLYRSLGERQWSMASAPQADDMSQKSFSSSSVLPLISTKQARNRSFLVGSVSGSGSLLGAEELERFFPDRKMRIFVGTWNMCEMKNVPESVDDFVLPDSVDFIQDVYVIGTQESTSQRREWEIKLQETLGPQHVLFHSAAFGVLYLTIFLRRDLAWFCSVSEEANVSVRAGPSGMKTKGGLGVCFTLFGTSFLFVDSHFSPHDGNMKERCADFSKICSNLQLPKQKYSTNYTSQDDVTGRFDCVFWMGDLNFRIEKERERVTHKMRGIESQSVVDYEDLLQHDELFRARNEGLAFQEFQEGRIKFKPTYKYDVGTGNFDTSKKLRIPSYTDRILFRSRKKHAITCLYYNSAQEVTLSDHKPVYGMYEVTLRPGRDNIPLAAGQFNREVWLEANRRRSGRLEVTETEKTSNQKSSSICSIQ